MSCNKCGSGKCTCTGCKISYTDCIFSKVAYSCIGTGANATLDTILAGINTRLCNPISPIPNPVWNNITGYLNGYVNAGSPFQVGQYSNPSGSIVRLRGVLNSSDFDTGDLDIFRLPVGFRPLSTRFFSVTVSVGSAKTAGLIGISSNGFVALATDSSVILHDNVTISLDGITFETN